MRRLILGRGHSGFSLIEIIVALGIGSLLVLYSGDLIVRSQMQEQKSSVSSEVDRVHLINLQRSRNPRFLQEKNLIYSGISTGNQHNAELCMSGKIPPGGCAGFNQTAANASTFNDNTNSPFFFSRISAQRLCDARGCHKVQIEVRTGDSNASDQYDIFERKSVGYIPAYTFVSNSDIDIDCGNSVMTGMNYYQMQPQCGGMVGNFQCDTGNRIMNFGEGSVVMNPSLCSGMARQDCSGTGQYGVDATGLLLNQQGCQGPALAIGSGCVPSWLPRTSDVCSGTNFTQTDGCGQSRSATGVADCTGINYPNTTSSGPYVPPPTTTIPRPTTTTRASTTTTVSGGSCHGRVLFPYSGRPGVNCTDSPLPDSCNEISCSDDGTLLQNPYGGCANAACVCRCMVFTTTTAAPTTTTRATTTTAAPTTTLATTTTTRPPTTTTAVAMCVAVPRAGWCFSAGTLVTMADGSKKPIEKIMVGEKVSIFDEQLGRLTTSEVEDTLHHPPREQLMYQFKFSDGSSFKVTGEHSIYSIEDGGYIAAAWLARDIQIGRSIHVLNQQRKAILVESVTVHETNEPTYNIHVVGIPGAEHEKNRGHNYFANGILAHNLKACCGQACQECLEQGRTGCVTSWPPGRFPNTGVNCRSDYVETRTDWDPCQEEEVTFQACGRSDPMCP